MEKLNETFKGYSVLNVNAIPQIPCIKPYTFAVSLAKGEPISNYTNHLLACAQKDFGKIGFILLSHNYNIDYIETFDYGQKDNKYVYFKIIYSH